MKFYKDSKFKIEYDVEYDKDFNVSWKGYKLYRKNFKKRWWMFKTQKYIFIRKDKDFNKLYISIN